MSAATSEGTSQVYGVRRVCKAWEIARSTWYAQTEAARPDHPVPAKRGPKTALSDAALVAAIRAVLAESAFIGEGYRKVWAKLRAEDVRTGKRRVLRLMGAHGLLAPQRGGSPRGPQAHDGTINTKAPDEMWGTDFSTTVTLREGTAAVFIAVDHCTAELVGVHAAARATRWEALEPIRQAVRERYGRIGEKVAQGLRLRHDHGTQYMADDFQQEIAFLGIDSSPSFVRAPEGNGCAERMIRTLKEQVLWVRTFETVEELRQALLGWQKVYNERWMVGRHGHRSPAQVRRDHHAAQQKLAA
jgi:transposase InsO family protein